jgi:hypothetical protein
MISCLLTHMNKLLHKLGLTYFINTFGLAFLVLSLKIWANLISQNLMSTPNLIRQFMVIIKNSYSDIFNQQKILLKKTIENTDIIASQFEVQ